MCVLVGASAHQQQFYENITNRKCCQRPFQIHSVTWGPVPHSKWSGPFGIKKTVTSPKSCDKNSSLTNEIEKKARLQQHLRPNSL
jgi:hypothetical protein